MKQCNKIRERSIESILLDEDLVTPEQLQNAKEEREATGESLISILIKCDFMAEKDLARALVKNYNLPFIYTRDYNISKDVRSLLPTSFLHSHGLVPLDLFGNVLIVASSGDLSEKIIQDVERTTGKVVAVYIAMHGEIQRTLNEGFPLEEIASELSSRMDELFGCG